MCGNSHAPAHTTTHPPPSPRGQQKPQEGSGGGRARPPGEGQSRTTGVVPAPDLRGPGARCRREALPFSPDGLEGRLTQRELRAGAESQSGVRLGASSISSANLEQKP